MSRSRQKGDRALIQIVPTGGGRGSNTFHALKNRDFRVYWLGRLTSMASFHMATVAQGWLVYELTGSALSLGWVAAGQNISMVLFSLYGGVISDRFEKRTVLVWGRVGRTLVHVALLLVVWMGVVQVWHVVIASVLTGVLIALSFPSERSIVPELVERRMLLNAESLNSVASGLVGIIGAGVAGLLIEIVGAAGAYGAVVAFHLLNLLFVTRLPVIGRRDSPSRSVLRDLRDALRYIRGRPVLVALLGLGLSAPLLSNSYRTFMPKFAVEVLGLEATGLGLLLAAPGVGSLICSLAVASLGDFRSKGKLLLGAGVVLGVSLVLFVNQRSLSIVLLFLALTGAAEITRMVSGSTLLQTYSGDQFRGRVISVSLMMWGLNPLGTLPAGAIADKMGVPFAVTLQGVLLVAVFLALGLLWPRIRRLE